VNLCDSGCGLVRARSDQGNDALNSIQLQESDNQLRYSELFKRIFFSCIKFVIDIGEKKLSPGVLR